jgi:hypothetical protein
MKLNSFEESDHRLTVGLTSQLEEVKCLKVGLSGHDGNIETTKICCSRKLNRDFVDNLVEKPGVEAKFGVTATLSVDQICREAYALRLVTRDRS